MTPEIEALAPLPAEGTDPTTAVAAITRASGTSFASGMRALSRPRREAMWALYAFSRVIDDIADEGWPLEEKHRLLDDWRAEIERLYQGCPVSTIGLALAGPVERYALPKAEFLALIEGMQMDADGPIVGPPMAELRRYTRRVAGAVGLLSMRIFGAWQGAPSERFALALADALQFTNILRDVEEDAVMGRVYLPREMLARHGVPADATAVPGHPALAPLGREFGRLARAEFDAARAEIPAHGRLTLMPALLMMGAYESYLNRLSATGFRRDRPVTLSKPAKLAAGFRCLIAPASLRRDD